MYSPLGMDSGGRGNSNNQYKLIVNFDISQEWTKTQSGGIRKEGSFINSATCDAVRV